MNPRYNFIIRARRLARKGARSRESRLEPPANYRSGQNYQVETSFVSLIHEKKEDHFWPSLFLAV
jgi:hypothetical protein